MEEFLIKYCIRCKEVKPPDKQFCTSCGSQAVVPPTEKLKLEVAAWIMSRISINGNGNGDLLRKVQELSMATSSISIRMKFCGKCKAGKPHDEDFCDEHGSRLIVPKTDRERLLAISWLLYDIDYFQDEDSRRLLALRMLITGNVETKSASLTAIAQSG